MDTYETAPPISAGRTALGVVSFLVLAFGIAWGSWEALLPKDGGGNLYGPSVLPGAFAPAIACFIVRKWITREGFADAGLALHLRYWPYYFVAWFLPLVVLAFIVASASALGIATPDFSLRTGLAALGKPAAFGASAWYAVPLITIFTAPVAAPLLFGEEFGWRGYLQLRLFATRPTLAAVATGIIWGLWHLPILVRSYEFHGDRSAAAVAVFCVCTVLISIIFGWLRRRSGSIWVTSLAHAATNAIGGSLTTLWYPATASALLVFYGGVLSWIPLGLFSAWIVLRGDDRENASL